MENPIKMDDLGEISHLLKWMIWGYFPLFSKKSQRISKKTDRYVARETWSSLETVASTIWSSFSSGWLKKTEGFDQVGKKILKVLKNDWVG